MKNDPKSHAIHKRICKYYEWFGGFIYQEQRLKPVFKVIINSEAHASVIGCFRPLPGIKSDKVLVQR
jgi:hypothetical protein